MTHRAKRSTPRRPVQGQRSLGLMPELMRSDGYCSRCNRDYADIIAHRTTIDHRQRAYRAVGTLQRHRPAWLTAIRSDPDAQYAAQDAILAERRQGIYPPVGIGRLIGDPS